ncbi:mitochondrial ribosomal subunit s27 domain-containing protein [Sarocladium implicatum]|nr:mitochondrial ribosomal subunit s27 domain-containing protein [Sarocladium implicatum]
MSVPRARVVDLMKVRCAQCQVFATTFNPQGVRMGTKILRQHLKGPSVAAYYPRREATIKDVRRAFAPHLTTWDEAEEDRLEYIEEYAHPFPDTSPITMGELTRCEQTEGPWKECTKEEESEIEEAINHQQHYGSISTTNSYSDGRAIAWNKGIEQALCRPALCTISAIPRTLYHMVCYLRPRHCLRSSILRSLLSLAFQEPALHLGRSMQTAGIPGASMADRTPGKVD